MYFSDVRLSQLRLTNSFFVLFWEQSTLHNAERQHNSLEIHNFLFLISRFDWWCFCYFVRNSLAVLLEALRAQHLFLDSRYRFFWHFFFPFPFCVCARPLSLTKAFLPLLPTRLLCLVVAIPLASVLVIHVCLCVCASVCACETVYVKW